LEQQLKILECLVMYSYLRMQICLTESATDEVMRSARLVSKGGETTAFGDRTQSFSLSSPRQGTFEALVDRNDFPHNYEVEVSTTRGTYRVNCGVLVDFERQEYARSSLGDFLPIIDAWRGMNPGRDPKVLDIGGRARSGNLLAEHMQGCDVTVLDIKADHGVDVVADIHAMTDALGEDRFDFLVCVSVFEHLVMPWKAALEINKVMKLGGVAFIQTHQTVGMHDLPWDYYRFSDESWKGLFNSATGFEIVATSMNDLVRIVPVHYFNVYEGFERAGGFIGSSVIARKVGPTPLCWPVEMTSIVSTSYPD